MLVELPWPPQVNHYYTIARGRKILGDKGRKFRASIVPRLGKPLAGRLHVTINVYPPDRRRRDLDNLLKAILDGLQYAGYYEDDSQIDDLLVFRREPEKGGRVAVQILEG